MEVDLCGLQDLGDCLAMTFSVTVQPKKRPEIDPDEVYFQRRLRRGGGTWS